MSTSGSNHRHRDQPGDPGSLASEGAATLDRLIRDRLGIERATVFRVFHQIHDRSPDELPDQWWQIFADAASTIQLRPMVLDCSVEQIRQLAKGAADVVLLLPGTDATSRERWVVLHRHGRRGIEYWDSATGKTTVLRKSGALRELLSSQLDDQRIRCVAFDWDETNLGGAVSPHEQIKPLARVLGLLRPEWPDIWLILVFAFVVGLLTLATPIAVESLVNTVAFGRFFQPILVLAIVLLTFLGFEAIVRAIQAYVAEIVQQRLFARVAGDLSHRLPRVSAEATEGMYLPELVNRFFDVATVQKVTAFLLLDGISLVLSAGIGMAVLAFYHPFLLGVDLLLLASIAFIIIVMGRGGVKTAVKESKSKYYMAAWLEDIARCHRTFRSAAGKNLSASRSDRLVHDYLTNRKKHFRVLLRQILFALGLQAVASAVLLGLGGYLVIIGELTLGQLVAAELIVTVIVGAFAKMGKHIEAFYDLLASTDKLGALFDLPLAKPGTTLRSNFDEPSTIEATNLQYSRSGGGEAFEPITLSIPAGGSLAVIGPSGSGKTTLLDLIYGCRRPTLGQLKVDGSLPCDLQSDDFWSHVELVRDGEVFAGTVEENLHLHRNDISGQDVEQALEAFGLTAIVAAMEDGLQSHIESDGSPLTVNQVRLLLLARAVASRPTMLLVDGLLDSLSDDEADQVLSVLLADDRPWTLVVATGRRWIAARCQTTVRMPTGNVEHSVLVGDD